MPTYEYVCTSCGTPIEVVQSIHEPALSNCPSCADGRLRKVFGNVGVVFKGSGFYRTDSRAKSASTARSTGKPEAGTSAAGSAGSSPAGTSKAPAASNPGSSSGSSGSPGSSGSSGSGGSGGSGGSSSKSATSASKK